MAQAKKKKGGKGLMIGLVLLFLFGGVGAVFGLAMTGKINIPGITQKKKPTPAAVAEKTKAKPIQPTTDKKPEEDASKVEPKVPDELNKQGATKLAEVWNEMPTSKLIKVVEKWQPSKLAMVMNEMDPSKVADLLGTLKPDKASTVSREMGKLAAQLPAE